MKERITEILSEITEDPKIGERLSEDYDIINEVGLDSLQMIQFVLQIEDEFGVEIDFEDFDYEHLESVNRFCDFISSSVA